MREMDRQRERERGPRVDDARGKLRQRTLENNSPFGDVAGSGGGVYSSSAPLPPSASPSSSQDSIRVADVDVHVPATAGNREELGRVR